MDAISTPPREDARSCDISEQTIANGNILTAMRLRADLAEQRLLALREVFRDMREDAPPLALPKRVERKGWFSFRRAS